MFTQYYRLSGHPFQLTPDSRFYFGSQGHSRAFSHLVYGLSQEEGFIVITGEVGAGKTTIVEQLWAQLDRNTYVIGRIVTTQVAGDDLLRLAVASFGMQPEGVDKATLLRRMEQFFREQRQIGRRCLLVVDEVQNLSIPALEELRMLSNITIETGTGANQPGLQTILLGQPQFRRILANPELEQLRQRVLASYHLGPMSATETQAYIVHRMKRVGWLETPAWEDAAWDAMYRGSDGIPRRINTLGSRVLLLAALEEAQLITAQMVDATAAEMAGDLGGAGGPIAAPGSPMGGQSGTGAPSGALANPAASFSPQDADLLRRVEVLEQTVLRQGQIFRRLQELMGTMMGAAR